jgi:hypothetical protein
MKLAIRNSLITLFTTLVIDLAALYLSVQALKATTDLRSDNLTASYLVSSAVGTAIFNAVLTAALMYFLTRRALPTGMSRRILLTLAATLAIGLFAAMEIRDLMLFLPLFSAITVGVLSWLDARKISA